MKIHDISLTVSENTVTWDNTEQGFSKRWAAQIGKPGEDYNLSVLTEGAHTGTHVDAPLHFIPGGKSVEALDVNILVGLAQVVEIFSHDHVTSADIDRAGVTPGMERLLLKTDNTRLKRKESKVFDKTYVGLAPSGAQWLVSHGVRLIGIDYLSIGPLGPVNTETHRIVLGAGMVVVESLVLDDIAPGAYTLIALPPKFQGLEGSPCRALLIEGELVEGELTGGQLK